MSIADVRLRSLAVPRVGIRADPDEQAHLQDGQFVLFRRSRCGGHFKWRFTITGVIVAVGSALGRGRRMRADRGRARETTTRQSSRTVCPCSSRASLQGVDSESEVQHLLTKTRLRRRSAGSGSADGDGDLFQRFDRFLLLVIHAAHRCRSAGAEECRP